MKLFRETIKVHSEGRRPGFFMLTKPVQEIIDRSCVQEGVCVVYSHHTTCSVMTQECSFDESYSGLEFLQQDLTDIFEKIIPTCRKEGQYMHPGPKASEFGLQHNESKPESLNTDAHLRSVFLGRSESIVIINGKLDLGEFGHIYFVDFDQTRPRDRQVQVQIIGLGIPCEFFAGDWETPRFRQFIEDFGKTAATIRFLRSMRVAVIGKMSGMNDILADEMSVFKKLGPEYVHDTLGPIYRNMEQVTEAEIDERIRLDKEIFDVDPKLSYDSHAYAARFYLGIKKYLINGRFSAFTIHFDNVSFDGRFKQLPLMAASHLLAEGYGYAAEGDSLCASMVAAAHCLGGGGANFTEMYTMDFDRRAIIFCHAGEGNWATCRDGIKPKLIDRFLGEGGLENPPTPVFIPKTGPATLTSLAPIRGDTFRLVLAKGQMLPKDDLTRCEMPYFFWSPGCGVERCVEGWIKNGGTHHEVISLGDIAERWKMLAHYLGVEYVEL